MARLLAGTDWRSEKMTDLGWKLVWTGVVLAIVLSIIFALAFNNPLILVIGAMFSLAIEALIFIWSW